MIAPAQFGNGLFVNHDTGEGLQRVHGPGVGPKAGGEHIEGSVPVLAEVDVDETFVGCLLYTSRCV